MKARHKRLLWLLLAIAVLVVVASLIVSALRDNLVFYYTPKDFQTEPLTPGQYVRVGGLVAHDSIVRTANSTQIHFTLVDDAAAIDVSYQGLVPDLFKEGQGAVVEGRWNGHGLDADRVFAKHDENYMPPDVAEAAQKTHQSFIPDPKEITP